MLRNLRLKRTAKMVKMLPHRIATNKNPSIIAHIRNSSSIADPRGFLISSSLSISSVTDAVVSDIFVTIMTRDAVWVVLSCGFN
jgi:hypothetical protein